MIGTQQHIVHKVTPDKNIQIMFSRTRGKFIG